MGGQVITPIADDIWIVDGPNVTFMRITLPTRMTVVRLASGGLWVHSPIAYDPETAAELSRLGEVRHIVAPNKYHHLFLGDWIARFPQAAVHAAPGLVGKRSDLRFDAELGDTPHPDWAGQIEQVIFKGSWLFEELMFFHAASRTAILTDLIVNVHAKAQTALGRVMARLEGVAYPDGGAPTTFKLSVANRGAARESVRRMLAWDPMRVVISHGEWLRSEGREELARRFRWLLGS